ncbi:NEP1-interacting protein 1 isoform X2 [Cicer arietinum]|nr:NEP1-interacting protein 1 isoform X2 [Cicer arietinum]
MPILNLFPAMTEWFSSNGCYACRLLMKAFEKLIFAEFIFILALGGSIVGIIAGAIQGHTTEGGFLEGVGKGAVTGAIAALELFNPAVSDEPVSKVVLLKGLFNGKVFMEWICPAVAQAYECHINTQGTTNRESSDVYDDRGVTLKGMPHNFIQKLPVQEFESTEMLKYYHEKTCCSICFLDFEEGECVKILPNCCHIFHLDCIDE